ncbi:hypothetical protein FDECE_7337 [Fusarium decemcellulare]|nr:hypothetical protein FDECE_7337 [Fusarium decemcellulare]
MAPSKSRAKSAGNPSAKAKRATKVVPKNRRWLPGSINARQSREDRKRKRLAIRRSSFARLVREIVHNIKGQHFAMQHMALLALQESAENFIVYMFQAIQVVFLQGKCATLQLTHIRRLKDILTIFPAHSHRALMHENNEEGSQKGAEKTI